MFYGIQMAIENTFDNDIRQLRKHFMTLKGRYYDKWPMGWDRFSALMSAFAPSPDEMKSIADLLHTSFTAHVDEGTVCCVSLQTSNSIFFI